MTPIPPRWPIWVAAAAALTWLALAIALLIATQSIAPVDLALTLPPLVIGGAIALALAAPVAVIVLVAMLLRDTGAARAERTMMLADAAWLADHRLDEAGALLGGFEVRFSGLAGQLAAVAAAVSAHDQQLASSLANLETTKSALAIATEAATLAGARLAAVLPAASDQATSLRTLLATADADLQRQLGDTETLLAALWTRASDITSENLAATDAASRQIDAMTAAATAAQAAIAAPIAALDQSSREATDRAAAAIAATQDAVTAQAQRLAETIVSAQSELAHIGDKAASRADNHLAKLVSAAAQLTGEIDAQAERYRVFIQQLEIGFARLDERLVASVATGKSGLDTITAGMIDARDAVQGLDTPITLARTGIAGIATDVATAGDNAAAMLAAITAGLPAARQDLATMTSGLATLHESAGQFAVPIDAGIAAIAAAASAVTDAEVRLESAARRTAYELAAAKDIVAAIETQAGTTAIGAAAQLIEVFSRVRDVANQTAGTMRTTLAAVVDEAEIALASAGTARADAAFGQPIRAALADLAAANIHTADTAQAATERMTQRLLALTGTIASVESRIAAAEDAQNARLRDDIAARSSSLLAALEATAIDITTLLSADIDEAAWGRWLGGERGLFLRRAVRLVDARTARAIAGPMQDDAGFREAATRFIGEFEALIARVMPEREGRNLALALLSSDPGKLYIALSQSMDRLK